VFRCAWFKSQSGRPTDSNQEILLEFMPEISFSLACRIPSMVKSGAYIWQSEENIIEG